MNTMVRLIKILHVSVEDRAIFTSQNLGKMEPNWS